MTHHYTRLCPVSEQCMHLHNLDHERCDVNSNMNCQVDLSGNFIEEEGAQAIQGALVENKNLWALSLRKNHVHEEMEREIEEGVHERKMDFSKPVDVEAIPFLSP